MPSKPTWSRKLSRPITVKNGPTLDTLQDAADYILNLPEGVSRRESWQYVTKLLMAAANDAQGAPEATAAVEDALFMEAKWMPKRIPAPKRKI